MISLVVPAFDEADRVATYVPDLVRWVTAPCTERELVLVDDGSTDGTAALLEAMTATVPGARVVRRSHAGKGGAVAAGVAASCGDVVAFCDIDLSTPLPEIDRLVEAARRGPVLAIGSRGLAASDLRVRQHRARELLGKAYNRVVQAAVAPGITDTQCGAKAASRAVWDLLLARAVEVGFAWDLEIIGVARALGISVVELPVTWSHRSGSGVSVLRDGARMLQAVPRIRRRVHSITVEPRAAEVFDDRNAQALAEHDEAHWWFRSKAALIARWLPRDGGWLVDAGGGSGGTTAALGWDPSRVVLTDGSAALAAIARTRHAVLATAALVSSIPVRTGSARVLTLLDVIEHLDEPGGALREARRVLGPDGRLIVTVPAHPSLWSDADVILGHRRRYTRRMLRALLEDEGYDVEHLTHVFSWLVPAVWLVRRNARGTASLGLDQRSTVIDAAALVLTAAERTVTRVITLPFGTSILAVARPR